MFEKLTRVLARWHAKLKHWHVLWHIGTQARRIVRKPRWHAITLTRRPRCHAGTHDKQFSKFLWELLTFIKMFKDRIFIVTKHRTCENNIKVDT